MRKVIAGAALASALAVPVAAQAHGTEHHKSHAKRHHTAAKNCTTLHSYRFRARGGFVSFVPSTTPGAAPTDGVLTVQLRHVRRWASRRFLRSLAAPLNLPRVHSFTLLNTPVHFGNRVGSFANATSKDIVRVHGLLAAPARGCPGTYTLTLKRVFVTRVLPHHVRHHHGAKAHRS